MKKIQKKVLFTASLVSTAVTMGGCRLFDVFDNQNQSVYGPPPDYYLTATPIDEDEAVEQDGTELSEKDVEE